MYYSFCDIAYKCRPEVLIIEITDRMNRIISPSKYQDDITNDSKWHSIRYKYDCSDDHLTMIRNNGCNYYILFNNGNKI